MASAKRFLGGIYDELSKGRVEERPIVEQTPHRRQIYGYCHDRTGDIAINPVPSMLDTLIHELFHRRFPHWSERYVKQQTTLLIRSLSPEEQQDLYDRYCQLRTKVRRKKAVQ